MRGFSQNFKSKLRISKVPGYLLFAFIRLPSQLTVMGITLSSSIHTEDTMSFRSCSEGSTGNLRWQLT